MAYWLVKSEPGVYSYRDLERDGRTEWSGVHNASALLHLRRTLPGDRLLFYHSGKERACVGVAQVSGKPHPDPGDDRGSWSVEVRPVRKLSAPVTLAELRGDSTLAGFVLFRMSRLSVMPVTDAQWRRILTHELAGGRANEATVRARRPGPARASGSPRRGSAARRRR